VLCLQETKVPDPLFPEEGVRALGFEHMLYRGMKGYNGVAILSRLPLEPYEDAPDWCAKGDCRHVAARIATPAGGVELHDFYVPAGGDVPDRAVNEKYGHKLDFIGETRNWFAARSGLSRAVLVGDLNIAPLEHDVWSHKQLLDVVSHTPVETDGLRRVLAEGRLTDIARARHGPGEKIYTWWSYRARDWEASDRGRRLDHIWAAPQIAERMTDLQVLKPARGWDKPSDHVPVIAELDYS